MARVARAEASLPCVCFDASLTLTFPHTFPQTSPTEPEVVLCLSKRLVPRLTTARLPNAPRSAPPSVAEAHVVTGGTGGLGLLTARWLGQRGVGVLVLASRQAVISGSLSSTWNLLLVSGASVFVEQCDTADVTHVRRLMAPSQSRLAGVWHAAGTLADSVLHNQTAEALCRVYSPKVHGAWNMQAACAGYNMSAFSLFSSIAALLGGAGQANYSAANACLDTLAGYRHSRAFASSSVQWGAWAEVGMAAGGAANARTLAMETVSGLNRVGLQQGLAALHTAALPHTPCVIAFVPAQWIRTLGGNAEAPTFLSVVVPRHPRASIAPSASAPSSVACAVTLEAVMNSVALVYPQPIGADVPLMEGGLDSLAVVELRRYY